MAKDEELQKIELLKNSTMISENMDFVINALDKMTKENKIKKEELETCIKLIRASKKCIITKINDVDDN